MKLPILAAAAALMMVGAASAQPGQGGAGGGNPMMAKMREACSADVQKLCPDKKGPERRQCMADNKDKLSDGCKAAMAEMMKGREGAQPQ